MTQWLAAALQIVALVAVLAAVHVPLGDYMARVYQSTRHWRAERWIYRLIGVDPDADQRWPVYLRSVLVFSVVAILALFAMLRLQPALHRDQSDRHDSVHDPRDWMTSWH